MFICMMCQDEFILLIILKVGHCDCVISAIVCPHFRTYRVSLVLTLTRPGCFLCHRLRILSRIIVSNMSQ